MFDLSYSNITYIYISKNAFPDNQELSPVNNATYFSVNSLKQLIIHKKN